MPDFHYLGSKGFPHGNNIDVYQYDNQLNYSRYDYSQMSIQVCSVPWEQGEAHIGQRTLSGIGNVVHFGTSEARDAYFDAIPDDECFRWETKFKELHSDLSLRVPLPFDVANRYNYVRVKYNLFANDSSKLEYESEDGVRIWHYFIREARFIAPNTSELVLLEDVWQTWIYDLQITTMILQRGHAPLFATPADTYLQNPINHCADLLAEDVNFGELQRVSAVQGTSLNAADVRAVIITSADPKGSWGSKSGSWATPAGASYDLAGVPNMSAFAIATADLDTFLINVTSLTPQFKQTVQCIFFCESAMLNLGNTFAFCNVTCTEVLGGSNTTKSVYTPSKVQWGYPSKYQDLAKLYTYPYSALEITDERGESELVRIEDTSGSLTIDLVCNIIFPYIKIQGSINGIGGNASTAISFRNIDSHTFTSSGRWYEHLRSWDVPTFAVVLDAAREYDYSTHYDRVQMENDRDTAKTISNRDATNTNTNRLAQAGTTKANANASALAAKTTADASAATASTNSQAIANAGYTAAEGQADASYTATDTSATATKNAEQANAQNVIDNATAQTTANTTVTTEGNSAATRDAQLSNSLAQAIQAWDAGMTRATANNQIQAANASTAIGAAGGVINSAAGGAISGFLSGGPVGAAGGAISGLVGGGISAAVSLATNAVSVNATTQQAEDIISNTQSKLAETQQSNLDRTARANTARTNQTTAQNLAISTSATNTSLVMSTNATNIYTATVNAADTIRDATIDAADVVRDAQVAAAQALATTNTTNNQTNYDTSTANNDRTYNTTVAIANNDLATANADALSTYNNAGARIQNLVNQAALRAPFIYGRVDGADLASSRPIALYVNVVTESDYAIERAGDEFLRYGYYLDKQWAFDGNWCLGDHFTFWQLRDYWSSNQIPDRFADQIRFLLFGGVTVWSNPDDIGKVTIYDNGI